MTRLTRFCIGGALGCLLIIAFLLGTIAGNIEAIADAQIALASEGCYEVPEASHAVR